VWSQRERGKSMRKKTSQQKVTVNSTVLTLCVQKDHHVATYCKSKANKNHETFAYFAANPRTNEIALKRGCG